MNDTFIQFEIILKKGALMFSKFAHMQSILIFQQRFSSTQIFVLLCLCVFFSFFSLLQSAVVIESGVN